MPGASEETRNELIESGLNPISGDADRDLGGELGESSSPEPDLEDLSSQKELDASQAGGEKPEGEKEGEKEAEAGGEEDPAKGQEARIDKDPVFKRLHGENQRLRDDVARISTQIDTLLQTQPRQGDKGAVEETLDYTDITTLSTEEREDWRDRDPLDYEANLTRQIRAETTKSVLSAIDQKSGEKNVEGNFKKFVKDNPDFTELAQSGAIQKYRDDHPGVGPYGAYYALTMEAKLETAKSEASQAAEEKANKHNLAKRQQKIPGAHTAPKDSADPYAKELENTKLHGGRTAVLARRLERRRQEARGG